MLLDCFTIPCAMLLSYTFLSCSYTWKHFVGVVICLSGLICIVINDTYSSSSDGEDTANQHPLIGDMLCLVGAVLYACSNVLQEKIVKFSDRYTFIGRLGLFGFLIALVQFIFLDLSGMRSASYSVETVFSMAGFVGCLFLMYINTSAFLQGSDAIVFNLSLLTSDVYAVIFTYFFSGYLVSWLYFLSFALVIAGLTVYHSEKAPLSLAQMEVQEVEGEVEEARTVKASLFDRVSRGGGGVLHSLLDWRENAKGYCPVDGEVRNYPRAEPSRPDDERVSGEDHWTSGLIDRQHSSGGMEERGSRSISERGII